MIENLTNSKDTSNNDLNNIIKNQNKENDLLKKNV